MSTSHSSWSRSNDCNSFAITSFRNLWQNPSIFKSIIDYGALNVFDCYSWFGYSEDAGAFARSWTHSSGKFWEVVRLQQLLECFFPIALEDEIVPFWNDVSERTSMRRLTERYSAVHASSGLNTKPFTDMFVIVDFIPIFQSSFGSSISHSFARILDEPSENFNTD